MNHNKINIAIVIAAFCSSLQSEVWARSVFDSGVNHYKFGQYSQAAIFFSEAAADEPNNPLVHYYLANTMVHLDQREQSLAEYELGYRLDPRGQVGRYCKQALQSYNKSLSVASAGATIAGIVPVSFSNASPPPIIRGSIVQTESVIRRQANYEKEKHRFVGESWASEVVNQAESEARRIQEEAAQEIERALNPGPMIVGQRAVIIPFDLQQARARAEQIKRLSDEAASRARLAAEEKANQYRQWSREKQYALDEVVANLESQLESPLGHSNVKLQAIGTDLYVRYYGPGRAESTAVRAVDQAGERRAEQKSFDQGDSAVSETLPSGRRASRSVHGKLLK